MPMTRLTAVGGTPSPVQHPPAGMAGGNVRVRPEVDVEQRPLRAFGQDPAPVVEGVVQVLGGVGDVRVDLLIELHVLVDDAVDVEPFRPVDVFENLVFGFDRPGELAAQNVAVQQVHDANAGPRKLVGVGRADAATGRPDLVVVCVGGSLLLPRLFDRLVVGHDEVGVVGDLESIFHVETELLDLLDLVQNGLRVEHDPVSDDARHAFVKDSARDEVEDELILGAVVVFPDDGVPCVGAALIPGDDVKLFLAQQVDDFSFSFVAPLTSDDDRYGHKREG